MCSGGFQGGKAGFQRKGAKEVGLSAHTPPKRAFAWDNTEAVVERERRFRWSGLR